MYLKEAFEKANAGDQIKCSNGTFSWKSTDNWVDFARMAFASIPYLTLLSDEWEVIPQKKKVTAVLFWDDQENEIVTSILGPNEFSCGIFKNGRHLKAIKTIEVEIPQ